MLRIQKIHPDAIIPKRATHHSAGYDVYSIEELVIPPGGQAIIPTGLSIAVPEGTYGRIAPRSGLAVKHAIGVGAGVIDRDYRGEVKVVLFNHHPSKYFLVHTGDRIAQLILECIHCPDVVECDALDATERGEGGFGSTGMH